MKRNMKYETKSKKIIRRYIPAVILVVIIIIIKQFIIQEEIAQDDRMSTVINLSGRQRMLSQRISKDALALYLAEDQESRDKYLNELTTSVELWKQSHINLQVGNVKEGLSGNNSDTVKILYAAIEKNHLAMLGAANEIISMFEAEVIDKNKLLSQVNVIQLNEQPFLEGMDKIVFQYDKEAREKIRVIRDTELILFWIVLGSILFEIIYIFIPAQTILLKAYEEIEESNENLMKIFRTAHSALFVVEESNFNILMMNKNAEKLVQDKDKNSTISNFAKQIPWDFIEKNQTIDLIRSREKMDNLELNILGKTGQNQTVLLSSIKGTFNQVPAIFLEVFDITKQKQIEETMRDLATKDELTGLYNRHFFDKMINEEMDRSDRYQVPLSMLILDLDHFKLINDNWGHPMGDDVLRHTARVASETIRKVDFLIRFGGEEFVLLMPNTNLEGAVNTAQKMRKAIERTPHPVAGRYTGSIGVAQKKEGESFIDFYKRADEALYRAKDNGRNQVVSAENET